MIAHYEPWQRDRVNGLPGLTGYWQVNGKNKTTFYEMIVMDLFYLKNLSILLDLKIIFKTCTVIAGQLLESQQIAQRNRSAANRTKLEGISIAASMPATAAQTGFETNQPTTTAFKEMV